ncbi:hypothetical protein J3R82DRAFT_11836 [Butyriboletus roseoflavus]|nr:hypothetical protein J3R82DRAFT_11836 [Butyriboletus roseoflavus]
MYEPIFAIPEADIPPFPLIFTAENQANSSQTYTVIPTERNVTGCSLYSPIEGLVAAGNMHEIAHENNGSQDVSTFGGVIGFPAVPFAAAPATCGLAGGLYCTHWQPLDHSVKAIRMHIRMHGHRHPQRQIVQCPWMGCSHTSQWANIPRHIQSVHLGVRFVCSNCGTRYTRQEGLTRHTASLKCNGATYVMT